MSKIVKVSKLRKFIDEQGGPKPFAKKMGLSHSTIYMWLSRAGNHPCTATIIEMIKLSKGKLTFVDIIEGSNPADKEIW